MSPLNSNLSRRTFLKITAVAGAGLAINVCRPATDSLINNQASGSQTQPSTETPG